MYLNINNEYWGRHSSTLHTDWLGCSWSAGLTTYLWKNWLNC